MAYRRKRRNGRRGARHCTSGYKRVRLRRKVGGRRYVLRCKGFSKRRRPRSRRRGYKRARRRGMAFKGSRCVRGYKRVRLRRKVGGRRYVRRCRGYGRRAA
jgi:hypothetical protein